MVFQGSGVQRGSWVQGEALVRSCIVWIVEERFRVMGPIEEGMWSWPEVETGTPW